jgi:hypothetical protein
MDNLFHWFQSAFMFPFQYFLMICQSSCQFDYQHLISFLCFKSTRKMNEDQVNWTDIDSAKQSRSGNCFIKQINEGTSCLRNKFSFTFIYSRRIAIIRSSRHFWNIASDGPCEIARSWNRETGIRDGICILLTERCNLRNPANAISTRDHSQLRKTSIWQFTPGDQKFQMKIMFI